MQFQNINYILFDAVGTLIHKPSLWPIMQTTLQKYGYFVPLDKLKLHHKIITELFHFPDRTSKDFYNNFNSEFLMSLGIIPSETILTDIYNACSYLPWERFPDTHWLINTHLPIGILSNFNNSLPNILLELFGDIFANIIISEGISIRKPQVEFFKYALDVIRIPSIQILYIGDSLKLDIIPAKKLGFQVLLIDRLNIYLNSSNSLNDLWEILSC